MAPLSKTARDFSGTNPSLVPLKLTSKEKKLIFSLLPHLTHSVSTYETNYLDASVDANLLDLAVG